MQTSLYDASQGKTSGGNINVITKGGSSHYHGEAYEFFRNEDLNANSFFFNKNGLPRGMLRQNQFGGQFRRTRAPVEETFFFASYEGTRQQNGLSSAIVAAFPVMPATRDAASLAAAFNIDPVSQVDPVAVKLLNVPGQFGGYLVPTGTGAAPGNSAPSPTPRPSGSPTISSTQRRPTISCKHRLSLRYFQAKAASNDPFGGGQTLGSGQISPITNYLASVSETWTVTPIDRQRSAPRLQPHRSRPRSRKSPCPSPISA